MFHRHLLLESSSPQRLSYSNYGYAIRLANTSPHLSPLTGLIDDPSPYSRAPTIHSTHTPYLDTLSTWRLTGTGHVVQYAQFCLHVAGPQGWYVIVTLCLCLSAVTAAAPLIACLHCAPEGDSTFHLRALLAAAVVFPSCPASVAPRASTLNYICSRPTHTPVSSLPSLGLLSPLACPSPAPSGLFTCIYLG